LISLLLLSSSSSSSSPSNSNSRILQTKKEEKEKKIKGTRKPYPKSQRDTIDIWASILDMIKMKQNYYYISKDIVVSKTKIKRSLGLSNPSFNKHMKFLCENLMIIFDVFKDGERIIKKSVPVITEKGAKFLQIYKEIRNIMNVDTMITSATNTPEVISMSALTYRTCNPLPITS
jgi:predicted transcriptional regulator